MPTLSIQTDQNVQLDLVTAGVGERILAYLIDMAIIGIYFFILFKVGLSFSLSRVFGGEENVLGYLMETLFFAIPYWFYDLLFEVSNKGRTPGKMIMKIQVIKTNGEPAGLTDYFVRWLFRPIDIYGHVLFVLLFVKIFPLSVIIGLLVFTCYTPGILGIIFAIRSKSGQRIGDLLAGTVTTKVKKTTSLSDTILLKTKKSYKVIYKNALKLSDRDVRLIKETLQYYSTTQDRKYVKKLSIKAQQFLEVEKVGKMTDIQFLRTLMKDYNHLAVEQDGSI